MHQKSTLSMEDYLNISYRGPLHGQITHGGTLT